MLPPTALSQNQLDDFERTGILRLRALLEDRAVVRARAVVFGALERHGLWKDGGWALDGQPRPIWPQTGPKTAAVIGHRHPELEELIDEPGLTSVVSQLLSGASTDRTVWRRPQVLFSLPNAQTWSLPQGWHVDLPRLPSGVRPGVQAFTFLDEVAARGGATLAVSGSHRLLNDGRTVKTRDLKRLLCRNAWFKDLYSSARSGAGERLPAGDVDGVPLQVIELTGVPGDVWLMDLRVLHAASPNASVRPRIMATHRFVRADLMGELAQAFGWSR
jgi:ectoine hydroxylase-related dioxygenase (phytanoyl-CoA dioxygenase family)